MDKNEHHGNVRSDLFRRNGMELRAIALHTSLLVEHFLNIHLHHLVGTDINVKKMTFQQKTTSLVTHNAMERKYGDAFTTFIKIRNELIHNFETDTLEKCLKEIKMKPETFITTYYNGGANREEKLSRAFVNLTQFIADRLQEVWDNINLKVLERRRKETQASTQSTLPPQELTQLDAKL